MAAEQKMHNVNHPPAGESRAVCSYMLDLTSWCVKSGTVQLPLALIGRFDAGAVVAQSDGGELTLELLPPRALSGFDEYFAVHGLRANDRLEFTFEGKRLLITAHRRDRQRQDASRRRTNADKAPARAEGRTPERADPPQRTERGTSGEREGRAEGGKPSSWTEAIDREVAQAALRREQAQAAAASIRVERFSGPVGELVPGASAAQQRAKAAPAQAGTRPVRVTEGAEARSTRWQEAQSGSDDRERAQGAGRSWHGPEIDVTRVRIEGGIPVQTARDEMRPKDRWSAHRVWARRENPQWHSLDTVRAVNDPDPGRDPDFPDTVVRAFRRSANGTLRDELFHLPADRATHGGAPASAPGRVHPDPVRSPEPAALRRSVANERSSEAAPARLGSGSFAPTSWAHVAKDQGASRPTEVEPPRTSEPLLVDDPLEAVDLSSLELHVAAEGPTPGAAPGSQGEEQREPRMGVIGRLGIRLGLGRERHPVSRPGGSVASDLRPAPDPYPLPPEAYPRRQGAAPAPEQKPTWRGAASATAVQDALIDPEAEELAGLRTPQGHPGSVGYGAERLGVDRAGAAGQALRQAPAPTATVEDDIAFIEEFLRRPRTPAIVRSLDIAERLGMSPERAARALDRMAENRERYAKIKDGAYMVRQKGEE